ncbi:Dolichyl-diphosphooligosaccharide--protein glycosyltransferase subunit WBP1 [Chytriomyces cf. hyalinus JEL632]|nr:Dolichyl-diphosphooligosaccharide--protein glycosyltransferase subunit WBP1 [Chytriomyces cf. hyalinus JEL632]
MRSLLSLTLALVAAIVHAAPANPASNKVLVVLNTESEAPLFSLYVDSMRERGFEVTVTGTDSIGKLQLVAFEEKAFDHLALFADSKSAQAIAPAKVIDFINRGGNVVVAASSNVGESVRDIAIELSADFDEKGNAVFDHFQSLPNGKTRVLSKKILGDTVIIPNSLKKTIASGSTPLVFKGVGHRLTGKNPLVMPVLVGNPTSFSYLESTRGNTAPPAASALVGSSLVLVSALQARNNARVIFSGSVDLFKNEFFELTVDSKKTANKAFTDELSKWVFQEKGVLEVRKVFHHRAGEDKQHGSYRIKEDLVYEIELSEFHDNKWHPYKSSTPIQFSATMLDPYIRQNLTFLKSTPSSSIYTLPFMTPDVYGVFTFAVEHKRREGYSWIAVKEDVSIHPFRHDEYPRFLSAAFPYYANVVSMMGGFVVLSAVVLYHRETLGEDKKVKKE